MQSHFHKLKTWPEHFAAVQMGIKTFEARRADRQFKVGDVLVLQEWLPSFGHYTGRECCVDVTHMIAGGEFGIEPGYVVMSCKLCDLPDDLPEAV